MDARRNTGAPSNDSGFAAGRSRMQDLSLAAFHSEMTHSSRRLLLACQLVPPLQNTPPCPVYFHCPLEGLLKKPPKVFLHLIESVHRHSGACRNPEQTRIPNRRTTKKNDKVKRQIQSPRIPACAGMTNKTAFTRSMAAPMAPLPPWPPVSNMPIPMVVLRRDRCGGIGQVTTSDRHGGPSLQLSICGVLFRLFQQPRMRRLLQFSPSPAPVATRSFVTFGFEPVFLNYRYTAPKHGHNRAVSNRILEMSANRPHLHAEKSF